MISLRLSGDDLARTRVAYSALWEAVASFTCLERPETCGDRDAAWAGEARTAVAGLELEPLSVLVCGRVPDFLLPVPEAGRPASRFAPASSTAAARAARCSRARPNPSTRGAERTTLTAWA